MKCDELQQVENPIEWGLYYDKNEVDAAIDELKREHHRERHEYISFVNKLQKENAELKRRDTEHTVHIAKMNADLRKTQRALWLARAERAKWQSLYYWYAISDKYKSRKFDEVERKCRAKAEEYK